MSLLSFMSTMKHRRVSPTTPKVSISPPSIIEGWLSEICWEHIEEWVSLHDHELLEAWDMLREGNPVSPVEELR